MDQYGPDNDLGYDHGFEDAGYDYTIRRRSDYIIPQQRVQTNPRNSHGLLHRQYTRQSLKEKTTCMDTSFHRQ